MVAAAACGRLDYAAADSSCKRWRLREKLILNSLAADKASVVLQLRHNRYTALAGGAMSLRRGNLVSKLIDAALQADSAVRQMELPHSDVANSRETEFERLKAEWERRFGKWDDPATQARIREDDERLRSAAAQRRQKRARDAAAVAMREKLITEYRQNRFKKRGES